MLIWGYLVTVAVLAVWTIDGVRDPLPTYLSIAIFACVALALTVDTGEQVSMPVTVFVIVASVLVCLLVSWQLLYVGYTQWYLGASACAFFCLCLRGRILLSWLGFALMSVVILVWSQTYEVDFAEAILNLLHQAPILIIGTLFATGLRRTGDEIKQLTSEGTLRAAAEAASIATSHEREERLHALNEFATPMLEKLAADSPISPADRLEYALAEAELRDTLRAPSLVLPDVSAAARSARQRGVEVVLLDDSEPGELGPGDLARAASRISALINSTSEGRVTARLLPAGRESIATIVVDGSEHHSEDVPALT